MKDEAMMLEAGRVVFATHGRDKGSVYLVTGEQGERVLIADGRRRKLHQPKAKNPAHLVPTEHKIPICQATGNRRLRELLNACNLGEAAKQTVNK